MSWLAFAQAYTAMLAFALAMPTHHQAVFQRAPKRHRTWRWRTAGVALCVGSLAAAKLTLDWQIGIVLWIAMLALSGFALTQFLAFAPRWSPAPAVGLLLLGLFVASL